MLSTIERAGRVLDLFTKAEPEWGATAVGAQLGVAKSQAHELLASLAEIGLLQRVAGGRYRIGWRVVSLNSSLVASNDLRVEAARVMQGLISKYGETVHLAVLERGEVVYIEKHEGTRSIRIASSAIGSRLPGHCSGVGKVLLAARPPGEVAAIVSDRGLEAFTPHTITDAETFAVELEQVRRRGYAYDQEEAVLEVSCVAAPIYEGGSEVAAALSMSVPGYRWSRCRQDYTRAVLAAAAEVTQVLRNLTYMRGHGHEPADRRPAPAPTNPQQEEERVS